MLERLELQNFQPHENFVVDFDPCITTIVGPTDAGKSSILRGLKWICLNQPAGNGLIKRGTAHARGRLKVDNHKLSRKRGKSTNKYVLDGTSLEALTKSGVPDGVAVVLNVSVLNFSGQHDAAFWLSETPGQVSRELNAIINLGVIDSTLAALASGLSKARAVEGVCVDRLAAARLQKEALAHLVSLDEALKQAEWANAKWELVRTTQGDLQEALSKAEAAQTALQKAKERAALASKASNLAQEALQAQQAREALSSLLEELGGAKTAKEKPIPDVGPLEKAVWAWSKAKEARGELQVLLQEWEERQSKRQKGDELVITLEKKLQKLIGKKCPVCGRSN